MFVKKGIALFLAALLLTTSVLGVDVSARSAVLLDRETGEVLFEKNAREQLPMASTTKIMTALCAIENGALSDAVTITPEMTNIEGSSMYLKPGEVVSLEDLLYGLMLNSGNDAAVAIAIHISGSCDNFAKLMNETAKRIGLTDTSFQNPNGLDAAGHYTTAYDLARLSAYALKNETFQKIVSTQSTRVGDYDNGTPRYLVNHNKLLKIYEGADGVKTGFTKKSGRCLVSSATRAGLQLVAVTLNAPNDWNDHKTMLDYGFENYEWRELVAPQGLTYDLPVTGGVSGTVRVSNLTGLSVALPKNGGEQPVVTVYLPRFAYAPVQMGQKAGWAEVTLPGGEIQTVDLFYSEGVEQRQIKKGLLRKLEDLYNDICMKLFG